MSSPVLYFMVAFVTAFIATLPFGPINLTVVLLFIGLNQLWLAFNG